MAFCTNCGHQLADGAKFCFECGVKVNQVHLDSSKEYVDTDENETQTRPEYENVSGGSSTMEFYEKDKSSREKYNYTPKQKRVIHKKILTVVCVLLLIGAILFGVISALGNGEKEYGTLDVTIEKNSQYSFGHNEWYLYTATAISDTLVKIEKWGKNFSTQKSFDYECDIGTFDITDGKYGFSWVDSSHTAFTFQLQDKSNGDFRKSKEVIFTILATNSDTNKGTNIVGDVDYYVYKNDDWHLYKGVQLSDTSIKIECWYRAMALGSFHYGYDVCVINLDDIGDAFEWTDEEHTSFTVSLQDKVNSDLKKAKNVVFVIEK